ncbi:hypothetical protein BGZ97_006244 [Linnemannia gamsii]|uniref:Uncharacterized protein n=1 Tax=Linnemannia gamsii TaxID=64522 RepID=A0A9P6QTH7_9FUNG|nr:hypothetical protein BGZ97_006244 [Linnemannia gamsii]
MSHHPEHFFGISTPVNNAVPLFLPDVVISYHERPFVQPPHNVQVQMAVVIPVGPIVVPLRLNAIRVLLALRIDLPRAGQREADHSNN